MSTTDKKPDLSTASNPRPLTEAESAWFGSVAANLANGDSAFVPETGERMALVRTKAGVLAIVDLVEVPKATDAPIAKAAPRAQRAELDPVTAATFAKELDTMTPGQSLTLAGGAILQKDASGNAWMIA